MFLAWLPRARRLLGSGEQACEAHMGCCGFLFCFVFACEDVIFFAYFRRHFPLDFYQLVKHMAFKFQLFGFKKSAVSCKGGEAVILNRKKCIFIN